MTPDDLWQREYQRWLARREKHNARYRWRYANEPGYRERVLQWQAQYRATHREEYLAYKREWMRRYRATQRVTA